jgi:hypothetical protein
MVNWNTAQLDTVKFYTVQSVLMCSVHFGICTFWFQSKVTADG